MNLLQKTARFFNSIFDFNGYGRPGTGGFYPTGTPGQAAPPVNVVYSDSGETISNKTAMQISTVWSCVWLISETIATLPFILNMRSGATYGKPALNNPLYAILNSTPNGQMSACEFWMMMIASEQLWGNGFALKTTNAIGELIALDPLRPEYMTPYRDPKSGQVRFKYRAPDGEEDYSADQIFHHKGRTLDGLVGVSRLEYARHSLGLATAADRASADTFRNGMRAGGFVTYDKFLKPDQRDQIRESLRDFTTGGPRSGGMMVLEGGMGFEALTMTPQDIALLASRQFAIEDICRWFGVPPVLIGHAASGTTSWGTGIEQLLLGWVSLNLRPAIRRIEQSVARQLIAPDQRKKFYLTIDTDDLLGADSVARSALYASAGQNGWMTRNEIRAKEDLAPMEGGDALTVQSNLIPLEKLGEAPPATAPPDKPIENEPGNLPAQKPQAA